MLKSLKGSKTILVNVLTVLSLAIAAVVSGGTDNLDPNILAVLAFVLGVVNTLLRVVTDTPVFSGFKSRQNTGTN